MSSSPSRPPAARRLLGAALTALTCTAAMAPAQDQDPRLRGFWPLEDLPTAALESHLARELPADFADALRPAMLSLEGGYSAAFVSADGLILTCHHAIARHLASLAEASRIDSHGWVSAPGCELPLPGLHADVWIGHADITASLRDADDREAALKTARCALEESVPPLAGGQVWTRIVERRAGTQTLLHAYERLRDLRLAWAPPSQLAQFGGDKDNFAFPRFCVDGAILRAFADGKPVRIERHLAVRADAAADREAVFALGFPGDTHRWDNAAELDYMRAVVLPSVVDVLRAQVAATEGIPPTDPLASARIERTRLRLVNSLRALEGERVYLEQADVIDRRRADEVELIAHHPELADDLARIGAGRAQAAAIYPRLVHASPRYDLMQRGRAVHRSLEGSERDRQRLADDIADDEPMVAQLERALIEATLGAAAADLDRDDPLAKILLADASPAERAKHLLGTTRLLDGGATARALRDDPDSLRSDPVVALCAELDGVRREQIKELRAIRAANAEARRRIEQAAHAIWGSTRAPDGDSTLRLSAGTVAGLEANGSPIPPRTSLGGLFARRDAFADQPPFDLPGHIVASRREFDPAVTLCFASTIDITGGLSGAPVLDADGRVLGVVFDGNAATLGSRFAPPGAEGRAVALAITAVLELLRFTEEGMALRHELGVRD